MPTKYMVMSIFIFQNLKSMESYQEDGLRIYSKEREFRSLRGKNTLPILPCGKRQMQSTLCNGHLPGGKDIPDGIWNVLSCP
jgi:hypothetical protein